MTSGLERELCDYLMLRHVQVDESSRSIGKIPGKLHKRWKRRWVSLSTVLSPSQSFVGYCKDEDTWLSHAHSITRSPSITRCCLGNITVETITTKAQPHILQINFKFYSIQLAFDSLTKRERWSSAIKGVSDRFHVDLVRCPEHPSLEGEYILEACSSSFRLWNPDLKQSSCLWEWQLKFLRRMHFHRNVDKLEVEAGRSTETGQGHFYFTGPCIPRLFRIMKCMMTTTPGRSSPSSSTSSTPPLLPDRSREPFPFHRTPSAPVADTVFTSEREDQPSTSTSGSYPDLVVLSCTNPPPVPPRDRLMAIGLPMPCLLPPVPPLTPPDRQRSGQIYMELTSSTRERPNQYEIMKKTEQDEVLPARFQITSHASYFPPTSPLSPDSRNTPSPDSIENTCRDSVGHTTV